MIVVVCPPLCGLYIFLKKIKKFSIPLPVILFR